MIGLDTTSKIVLYAFLWGALLLLLLAKLSGSRYSSTGLPFAFLMIYTTMHGGALVYLVEGYDHTLNAYLASWHYTRDTVAEGFEASFLAMLGAVLGFLFVGRVMTVSQRQSIALPKKMQRRAMALVAVGLGAIVIEAILKRVAIDLPGLQAILSSARNLCAVGALPIIFHRYMSGEKGSALALTAACSMLLPTVFLFVSAILADSVSIALAVFAFYLTLRPPFSGGAFLRNLAVTATVSLLAFVFAVFYLQMREELRQIIWSGGSISNAVDFTIGAAEKFDLRSFGQYDALEAIDGRLNQNIFVGLAIEKLRILPNTYENGETILLALFGWVPRFIWTDKPVRGGSTFIEKHTGKETDGSTTFGAGPIFEFYVNFAYWGVFLGFVILGSMLRAIDIEAIRALRSGNLARFAQYQLAGLAMLQPLADLFFIVTAVASSLIIGWSLRYVWKES